MSLTHFWRTYDQQELDWLEIAHDHLSAYEFKWNDTKVKFPKAFIEARPDAATHWVNQGNFIDFVTGET